jgi:nitroreductase
MSLIENLNWRYATKRMNGQKVPQAKLDAILEATRLSASSLGLQPYTIFVIENEAIRQSMLPLAYNQPQITEASQVLVFAAWQNVTPEKIDAYINQIAEERGAPIEALAPFKAMIEGTVNGKSDEEIYQWSARQAYIALGTSLAAAAEQEVDATPMEGFNPAALDELLGLKEKGLRSVALMAIGYRDAANDQLASAKKIRRTADKLFVTLN